MIFVDVGGGGGGGGVTALMVLWLVTLTLLKIIKKNAATERAGERERKGETLMLNTAGFLLPSSSYACTI